MIVTLVLCFLLLVVLISSTVKRPLNFPPGPAWLPIVGNTIQVKQLSKKLGGLHLAFLDLSKQWKTNILGLKMGKELVVVVFTLPVVKAVLCNEDYDSRPTSFFLQLRCLGSIKGITSTSGEIWNVQRNFIVKTLRTLGFGKKPTEQHVQQQVKDIIKDINDQHAIRIGKLVAPAVISILWTLITGTGLSRKDIRLKKLLDLFQRRAEFFDMSGGILGQHPWLRFVAPQTSGYNLINQINNDLKDLFMEPIEAHLRTWSNDLENTDLIYEYISEMKKEDAHYSFSNEQLLMVCLDLFIAGAQTTSSTLDMAFLMMLNHPDIQLKVQRLLDETCDKNEPVNYSDRHKVPYIEAVLLEVERYHTVTPITGPRRVVKDVNLVGYTIPKDTTILIHTHSVHMDPTHWEDPNNFRPERFLTENGNLVNSENLIPFGLGKRRCIGESFARIFIFIFFTEIIRNYSIVKDPEKGHITELPGLTISADYSAKFIKR